jgi:hypothetical protein
VELAQQSGGRFDPNSSRLRHVRRTLAAALTLAGLLGAVALVPGAAASSSGSQTAAADGQVPQPPAEHERKPKKHPKTGMPVDQEPPPPGAGDRIVVTPALNLYRSSGFRYQDTNYYACTATSAMDMLNFIAIAGQGGSGFRWTKDLTASRRDAILAWERTHDTLAGGNGSDPHGWRNALNYYGWGGAALWADSRLYEDYSFSAYERAVKMAVRQMIRYHKPVGIAAWQGRHAQMLTGYDGLVGDPFARDAAGKYTNAFSIAAVYLTDPLLADASVNRRIGYTALASTTNTRLRFQPYYETDSPYDDPYTSGWVRARDEWYGRWVIVAPVR